jgi:hypothetical protein
MDVEIVLDPAEFATNRISNMSFCGMNLGSVRADRMSSVRAANVGGIIFYRDMPQICATAF